MKTDTIILTFRIFAVAFIGLLFSCDNNSRRQKESTIQTTNNLILEKETILHSDTTEILGRTYFAYYLSDDNFFILNANNDTLLTNNELYPQFEFEDFDKDGYEDILFHYMSNTPDVKDLILFDEKSNTFKKVEDFSSYPAPNRLGKTKYYYSYHRSGCADMNWESDLFYIDNFKTYRIGNISGRECHDEELKDGIYISKVSGLKEIIYMTLPIETINKYENYKWGFIKDYWIKNYTKFIK